MLFHCLFHWIQGNTHRYLCPYIATVLVICCNISFFLPIASTYDLQSLSFLCFLFAANLQTSLLYSLLSFLYRFSSFCWDHCNYCASRKLLAVVSTNVLPDSPPILFLIRLWFSESYLLRGSQLFLSACLTIDSTGNYELPNCCLTGRSLLSAPRYSKLSCHSRTRKPWFSHFANLTMLGKQYCHPTIGPT